jgi:hypothetical protein
MRLSLRFLLPLAIALGLIAYTLVPLVDQLTLKWFMRDLEIRTKLIASAAQEPLVELLTDNNTRDKVRLQRVQTLFNRMLQDERLYAIGFCNTAGVLVYQTAHFAQEIGCGSSVEREDAGRVVRHPTGPLHVATSPITVDDKKLGDMVIVHDMSFVELRSADTKRYIVWLFAAIGAVIALITVVIAELSWRGWVAGMKALIRGQSRALSLKPRSPELTPIARDLDALVRDLERERRMRDEAQISWAPKSLRSILQQDLKGNEIIIVSNREPYMHVRRNGRVNVVRPASAV